MVSVMCTIDTSHEDIVHDAQLDYYGLRLATCSSDNSIKIFNIKNGTQTHVADLKGHYGPVWQISWAHPKFGSILASCSYDRKVIVWKEGREWNKIHEYSSHDASVNSVKFAPPEFGLMMACGSSDGAISIISMNVNEGGWEAKKIPNAHTIGCNAVSWCPARSCLVKPKGPNGRSTLQKRLVSGGCDTLIKIWVEEGNRWVESVKLDLHCDWVRDVAWAPDFASTKSTIASCSQDRKVIVWTSEDYVNWVSNVIHTFDDVVWNVSWSLTGNILAVAGGDNKVTLWKESSDGQWICICDGSNKGSNQINDQRVL